MRIIFMGTPEFAVSSLDALIKNNFDVVGVITVPDKPAGRGQQLQQSAVKQYAIENNLTLLQPDKLKDAEFLKQLSDLRPDLQIVVAFRMLPEVVWNLPTLGTYNLHASLLPKYRGAAPINWAIINGETESGVTTFKLKHEIDTGNILFKKKVLIKETANAGELHDLLKEVGNELIIKTANELKRHFVEKTPLEFLPQTEDMVCHAPKIFKEDCRIDWSKPVKDVNNLIRGLSPYPTAFTELRTNKGDRQTLKIFSANFSISQHAHSNGWLAPESKGTLNVYCNGGVLHITDLQLQGKKRMAASEFLKGFKIDNSFQFI